MVYEPDFLRLAPGDSVRFIPTQNGHNAASMDGLLPPGASAFKSQLNQPVEQSFEVPGFYAIQCSPHVAMDMVMLIQVGTPAETLPKLPKAWRHGPGSASAQLSASTGAPLKGRAFSPGPTRTAYGWCATAGRYRRTAW